MNRTHETVISNLINYEKEVMCRLGGGKSEKIKEGKEVKHTKKRVNFSEEMNKERPTTI